ncbi:MAG TPA: hypothetical protein VNO13_03430 [Candidatus Udaeobacter sp.]|nr:hypothetical protein [Candidatus Udaeobacter sp.]
MRLFTLFLLLAPSVFSQIRPAPASCGPPEIKFDVKPDKSPHAIAQPEPGKALVYIFEEFEDTQGGFIIPTIRVGLNGAWVGATRGASFLSFSVAPGEHHLCANWQSSASQISSQYSLTSFTAESGKVYFFKIAPRVESYHDSGNAWRKDLAPVDHDEANYLIGISSLSASHPHK